MLFPLSLASLLAAQPVAAQPAIGDSLISCPAPREIESLDDRAKARLRDLVADMAAEDGRWRMMIALGTKDEALAQYAVDRLAAAGDEFAAYRAVEAELKAEYGRTLSAAEMDRLWFEVRLRDAANIAELEEIIRTYGWPSTERIGGETDPGYILMHSDPSATLARRCLLYGEVKAGRMPAKLFGNVMDKVQQLRGEPFVYGVGKVMSGDGRIVPAPVRDEAESNRLRADIGLPPRGE